MTKPNTLQLSTHIQAAAGIVLNEQGELLLVKTHRHGWVMPGGIVEEGETVLEGLQREIREETGILADVEVLYCLSSNVSSHPGYNGVKRVPTKVISDFICRYRSGLPRPSAENSQTAWMSLEKAQEQITAEPFKSRFECYLAYQGRPFYLAYETVPEFQLLIKQLI